MNRGVRQHRVTAFCDWLDTIPPTPPFHTRPEFRFYADLTDAEIDASQAEMRRRADAALAMVQYLEGERSTAPTPGDAA